MRRAGLIGGRATRAKAAQQQQQQQQRPPPPQRNSHLQPQPHLQQQAMPDGVVATTLGAMSGAMVAVASVADAVAGKCRVPRLDVAPADVPSSQLELHKRPGQVKVGLRLVQESSDSDVVIEEVHSNTASAGILEPGDVLLAVNGTAVAGAIHASELLAQASSSDVVRLETRLHLGPRQKKATTQSLRSPPLSPMRMAQGAPQPTPPEEEAAGALPPSETSAAASVGQLPRAEGAEGRAQVTQRQRQQMAQLQTEVRTHEAQVAALESSVGEGVELREARVALERVRAQAVASEAAMRATDEQAAELEEVAQLYAELRKGERELVAVEESNADEVMVKTLRADLQGVRMQVQLSKSSWCLTPDA